MAYSPLRGLSPVEHKPKVKLAREVPEPPPITEELRQQLIAEARAWRAEVAEKVKAIELVTSDDLRVRTR